MPGIRPPSYPEFLLDHGAEQRASIHSLVTSEHWSSPAWSLVTFYYWAFFSVLALTRMSGRSIWFLKKDALQDLRRLAGAKDQPGAGAIRFEVGAYGTGTNRSVLLRPTKSQLHDAVWNAGHQLIEGVFNGCSKTGDSLEYRLWAALKLVGDTLSPDWASDLRNAVNYRAGYGYREVTKRTEIDMVRYIRDRTPANLSSMIDQFETLAFTIQVPAQRDLRNLSRLLAWYAILVARIIEELHADVLNRQSGDSRWSNLRAGFFKMNCQVQPGYFWPFSE